MERLAWLRAITKSREGLTTLIQGPGFISLEPQEKAYGSVAQLWRGEKAGRLMACAPVLQLYDGKNRFIVLQQGRDLLGLKKNVWGFPVKLLREKESPLNAAYRALSASLTLGDEITSKWNHAQHRPIEPELIEIVYSGTTYGYNVNFVVTEKAIIFYLPLEMLVVGPYSLGLADKLLPRALVKILSPRELDWLSEDGQLSPTSKTIWTQYRKQLEWIKT